MTTSALNPQTVDRSRLTELLTKERQRFAKEHPKSQMLFGQAKSNLLGGVPMNWMAKWAGDFPLFVEEASGARFKDVDGKEYVDLCLGDTAAMTGHAPAESTEAIAKQLRKGTSLMLPTRDAPWVGEELTRRFGLPFWQIAISATDANRFAIRFARQITGRKKILVFNYCYHGTVDETFVMLEDGVVKPRTGNFGYGVDPALTTKVVEFNDVQALTAALADRDVACVLAEPVMTNIGIIHPEPSFHSNLRRTTKDTGTLLILDETHTICTGPGGYTKSQGLEPDMLTIGKPIGSGIACAAYGFTKDVAEKAQSLISLEHCDTSGIGGTLAGNALSLAAMRATLDKVLTDNAYAKMIPLSLRFCDGVQGVINEFRLPWVVKQLGARAEYWFRNPAPKNGGEAAAASDFELDHYMHLAALNRGVLLTPFHNMALVSPATSEKDIDKHTAVFRESVAQLFQA